MKKLDIIYEDKELLVINKPANKLTIATNKVKYNTLYHEAREYVKKQNPKNKIFIVHRLDESTSGVIIFAKSEKIKHLLQDNWNTYKKEYIAIVENHLSKKKDTLEFYLKESKTLEVYVTNNKKEGKLAITEYEVIKENKDTSVLKINIKTGRKNQIRASLAHIGNPIIGDKKYHAKTNPIKRLELHASRLVITNPVTKKEMEFIAKVPKVFEKYM